jgi:hypothetical protein
MIRALIPSTAAARTAAARTTWDAHRRCHHPGRLPRFAKGRPDAESPTTEISTLGGV